MLTQSVGHDLPGEPEHFAPGELDFKEVAAEWEVIDAVLEPFLGTAPDEPDQVVEDEEEQIVFRTAVVGGPPRKIKKTANKISGVQKQCHLKFQETWALRPKEKGQWWLMIPYPPEI